MEKAYALGEAIANSSELANLREAEAIMYNDELAQKLIAEFQESQKTFQSIQESGQELSPEQEAIMNRIENDMENNPAISNYFLAQQKFEAILEAVNTIIAKAIGGEGEDCCSTDGCSSCGGGCC